MTDLTLVLKLKADTSDSSAKLKLTKDEIEAVNAATVKLGKPGAVPFTTQIIDLDKKSQAASVSVGGLGGAFGKLGLTPRQQELARFNLEAAKTQQEMELLAASAGTAGKVLGTVFAIDLISSKVREITAVTAEFDGINKSLQNVTGTSQAADAEFAFVRSTAKSLGLEVLSTARSYNQLQASSKGTALEGQKSRDIFTSVERAMAAMSKTSAETDGALNAIAQMMSKGTVQSEELRGQLGERLPGAFNIAARAMGVSTGELGKMLERGEVVASDFLPKFAAELDKTFSNARFDGINNNLNRISSSLKEMEDRLGQALRIPQAIDNLANNVGRIGKEMSASFGTDRQAEIDRTELKIRNLSDAMGKLIQNKNSPLANLTDPLPRINALNEELLAAQKRLEELRASPPTATLMGPDAALFEQQKKLIETSAAERRKFETDREIAAAREKGDVKDLTALYLKKLQAEGRYTEGDAQALASEMATDAAKSTMERQAKERQRIADEANKQLLNNARQYAEAELIANKDLDRRSQAELKANYDAKLITAKTYYETLAGLRNKALDAEIQAMQEKKDATADLGEFAKLDAEIMVLERQRADIARETAAGIAKARQEEADDLQKLQDQYDATGAAVRKSRDDYENLKQAFDSGKISSDQFDLYANNIGKGLTKIVSDGKDMGDGLSEFAIQGARNMQTAFADFLFDPFAQGTKNMGEAFLDTLKRMVANAASAQLMDALLGKDFGKSGDVGGLFGELLGSGTKGGQSAASGSGSLGKLAYGIGDFFASLFHEGGVVGQGGSQRPALAGWFDHAPRYHIGGIAGLAPYEVPAILKRGEEVLTANDPRHVANGGGAMQVHIHEAPGTRATVSQSQGQDGPRLDVIIEQVTAAMGSDIRRGGGLAQTLEGRYRLNPAGGSVR